MTTLFNYDPYYDDFDEDKNFMRVLFRPGYSVQARELTQLQTILANQIEKFGNHIFKNGSPIIGGKISLDRKVNYIILQPQYSGNDIDITQFLDKTIVSYGSGKNVRAKVIAADTSSGSPVLIIKYLSGDKFAESENIRVYGQNIFATLRTSDAVGGSFVASIQEGVYYFKGQFVKVTPQFLIVELFYRIGDNTSTINKKPSYKIGIEFTENIVDEIDDTSLLDPALGAFNYQAPGAERFQIITTLAKRTLDSADVSTFFEIIRIVDDVKTKEIETTQYAELEKTMARRTYDESGNYTVDPFIITLEEGDSANGKFNIVLDPGKAYVGGYEFETIAPTTIEVNRARDVSTASSYDLPTNFESSLVVANVRGTLDITSFPLLDIHSVPHENISISTSAQYNSTKIGTIYADMIRYNDAFDSSNGKTHTFTVNTFGANTVPISGTLAASGSSTTTIAIPATFNSALPIDAYANMYFRITDAGGASLSPILITSSNATTMNLASALPFAPSSNTFNIESDFHNAESLVANGGLYIAFAGNIDADSKDSTTGWASITEPKRTTLIFDTPYEAIKANTITNMDFYARKKYSGTTTLGKFTVTAGGTDSFSFSSGAGTISDSLILNNIIAFVRSDSQSNSQYGITPNTAISLANNLYTVTSISTTSFQVDLKVTETVKVDLFVTTKINNAEDNSTGITKRKQLVPITSGIDLHSLIPYEMNTGGTQGTTVLYSANTSGETTAFSGGLVFKSVGATNFDGATALTDLRTPGKAVSLQVPDVYQIIGIYDSKNTGANVSSAMLSDASYNITDNYEFDNGQRKTHYDHATIKLKRGSSAPIGRVFVQYRYFKNLSSYSGIFTVDSYAKGSNIDYGEISVFKNEEDKKLTTLRSAFDFRPSRAIGGSSLSGAVNPEPLEQITMDFDYYLNRIDQVIVKSGGDFSVIRGKSSVNPIAPPVDPKDMLIYTLNIPAYTETVKDIRADFKNHRRYTMQDIGEFENRIRGLEYYVSMNSLEKDAAATKILDGNGLERSKYGILVDNFTSKDNQATREDVGFDNRNIIENGKLYPASLMRTVKMEEDISGFTGSTKVTGIGDKKVYMLSYTTSDFAKQPYATKAIPLANALFANFKGTTRLFPEFTGNVDTGVTAKVTLNSVQGIENAFNFVNDAFKYISDKTPAWRDDKNSPFAQTGGWYTTKRETTTTRGDTTAGFGQLDVANDNTYISAGTSVLQKQISTSSSQVDVGTFVSDLAIQPYMKPTRILFTSEGLRPSTVFYSFFDNTSVNKNIVVPNKVTLNTTSLLFSGEPVLIANTSAELNSNVTSYLAGDKTGYSIAYVVIGEKGSANVSIINESGKPLTNKYIQSLAFGTRYQITSVDEHHSGVGTVSGSTIVFESDASSVNDFYNGNTVTIVRTTSSEVGIGEQYTISGYVGSTRTATLSETPTTTGSVVYSLGSNKSNKLGQLGGAFYMPSATFRSGQRNFRVTESFNNTYDADAVSFADKLYVSSGLNLNKTTLVDSVLNVDVDSKIVGTATSDRLVGTKEVSRVFTPWNRDPTAQTFYVDPQTYPYGVFLSDVDLFFRAKDDEGLPVTVQIRPTVNGAPSSDYWFPESVITKYPSEINISETPSITDSTTYTKFEFPIPVFLRPGLHALVILTDSPDYTIWEAEKGATTTNNEFVDKQPFMGTLYKSQNSMEYVPFLNEDLMFRLNRCKFSTNSATFSFRNVAPDSLYYVDKFRLLETSIIPSETITTINHSIVTTTSTGTKESTYRGISPNQTYNFATDDTYQIGYRRKRIGSVNDWSLKVELSTTNDAITPVVSGEAMHLNVWENFVDNGEINSEDFTIIAPGSGYSNSNTITITSSTGTGATANLQVDGNGNVIGIHVSTSGTGYVDDFDISYYTHPTTPATIVLNSEYDSSGGPCLARYITKPIRLADGYDAGDLRVFLSANKPGASEVSVFYKILSDTDGTAFKERPYQKMVCINPMTTSSPDTETFTELEFRPSATVNAVTYTGTNGVTYDTFKTYAIKIVLTSSDPAVAPSVRDLRIIATPAE